jgi:hypothetical protein
MLVIVRSPFTALGSRAKPFVFQPLLRQPALAVLICLALVIGLYSVLPLLFPASLSNQLVGRWQLQAQIRNGSRARISGEYEFRSDYTTRKWTNTSSTRAGLWVIRAPIEPAAASSQVALPNTPIVTSTYQFVDTLTSHFSAQIIDQQRAPDNTLWPGPGIYEITMINDHQLMLRIADADAGGWIVLECTKIPE